MLDCCANCRWQYLHTYGFSPKTIYDVGGHRLKINIAETLSKEIWEIIFANNITLIFTVLTIEKRRKLLIINLLDNL